ncbi:hypothetical protein ACMU_12810 [Actibacterium mucosum KCTC 23349]|uniref:NADH dehydrogenase n=1 Tax=Actibacterium mucosum KCTC 23349 TaxID=1454373 RepID=A0A037ZHF4_9RHOB|nr:hypothetical protein [Actibacterium mucosum]KAJ55568.1 hypothetical protein ACMU_12810 [Actibacterium mucosum KCTC 23349]
MKTFVKTTTLCLALSPLAAFAQDVEVTDDQLDSLRAAMVTAGCTIADEASATLVETTTGFNEETLSSIVAQLRVLNEIVDASDEGGITLISGACAS